MNTYHKIQTVYKRNKKTNFKTLLEGEFSVPEFEYLKNNKWVFTEKVDGTNIRIIYKDGKIHFKGKTDNAHIPELLQKYLEDTFSNKESFLNLFNNTEVCLYGEGYGIKINNGGKYRNDNSFVLFDIKIGNWWLQRKDIEHVAKQLDVEIVPVIGEGTLEDMVNFVRRGFKSQWGDFIAEGVVAKPDVELFNRAGHRIITKLKYKDFIKK